MATIDDFPIPDDLIIEFERIIDHISSASLKLFITSRPDLMKGFRPGHLQVKIICQRLKGLLKVAGQLDPGLVDLLAGESLNLEIIAVFSPEALVFIFSHCVSYFGLPFLVATLLDDRKDVRQMAIKFWQDSGGDMSEGVSSDEAVLILRKELEPFLEHMMRLATVTGIGDDGLNETSSKGEAIDGQVAKQYRAKIALLEGQQLQGKEATRLVKVLNEKIKGKDAELAGLEQKFSQEQKMRHLARAEADNVNRELAKVKNTLTEKIRAGVGEEVSSVVRKWLKSPQQIEKEVQALEVDIGAEDNLLVRAENVLARQALVDRNRGNRKVLFEQLEGLETIRDRVLNAASDALNPLPELRGLSTDIEAEISRLQRMLGVIAPENPALLRMHARINQVSNASDLAKVKKILFDLNQAEIYTTVELTALYDSYQDRQDQLYDRYGYPQNEVASLAAANILQLTAEKQPFHLVLDGHNIILDSSGLFVENFAEDGAGPDARNWLLATVDLMLQGSSCHASVFFDGNSPSVRSYSTHVKEIFSGGGGPEVKNRADQAIVSYLGSMSHAEKTPLPVIVVTNDRELQGLVQDKGAKIMPLAQFAVLVSRYHA